MKREDVIRRHKYFANIDGVFYRVRTVSSKKLFTKVGDVRCRKCGYNSSETLNVRLENLYENIPQADLDDLNAREKERKEQEIRFKEELELREKHRSR